MLGLGGSLVHSLGGEGEQFGLAHLRAGAQRGKDHRQLARVGIRRADGGGQLHGGVRANRVLDRLGVDVVAAADDQVLGAAAQVEALVAIQVADVACDQPAVGCEGLGGVGRIQKTREHVGRLEQHHARLTQRHVAPAGAAIGIQFNDAHLRVRQAETDAARQPVHAQRRDRGNASHLRHAQAFMHVQAELALKARRQLGRQDGGAGAAVAHAGNVGTRQRHLRQRRQHRGHGRQRGHAVFLHQTPEVLQHRAVAVQAGGRDDGFHPARERRQRAWQRARHVEQRVAVDDHVLRAHGLHLHAGPGGEHLCAVAVACQLGGAGGAAGVEVGGDVFGADVAAARQVRVRLRGDGGGEIQHAFGQRGRLALVQRRHAQHARHRRHCRTQMLRLAPDVRLGVVAPGDQHLGARGVQQRRQLVVGQQRIERLHDARRLAAPERQVVFKAAGQHHRHRVGRPHAQRVQRVGGLVNAGQQLAVRPADRLFGRIGRAQEPERGFVAKGVRRTAKNLVGAAHRQRLAQGRGFDLSHVGQAGHARGG